MPLDPDGSDTTGGNHVVLYCQEHSVHLAHMSPGTVRVAVGEQVAVGQLLGNVGTSGNSMEPHLHISAVEGRHANFRRDARLPGGVRATPLLIDGRFLIKGDNARGARP
jgi:murein DD-endopeptidase MepM/ murein hydrolase activator NlpD